MTWTIGTSRELNGCYELELHRDLDSGGRPLEARAFAWPADTPLLLVKDAVEGEPEVLSEKTGKLLKKAIEPAPAEYETDPAVIAQTLAADALRQIRAEEEAIAAEQQPAAPPADLVPPGTTIE